MNGVQAAEIAPPAHPKRPVKHSSMKVAAFSSATWANDADFEALREEEERKVYANSGFDNCHSLCNVPHSVICPWRHRLHSTDAPATTCKSVTFHATQATGTFWAYIGMTWGSLGVVYGDLGAHTM